MALLVLIEILMFTNSIAFFDFVASPTGFILLGPTLVKNFNLLEIISGLCL